MVKNISQIPLLNMDDLLGKQIEHPSPILINIINLLIPFAV